MRFLVLIFCCGYLGLYAQNPAFDVYESKDFIPFSSHTDISQPSASSDASITIQSETILHPVRSNIYGNNAATFQGNVTTRPNRMPNWQNAGHKVIRYPGGNMSNRWFWDGNVPNDLRTCVNGNGDVVSEVPPVAWMMETDEFPDLLDSLDAEGIVCVNTGFARYGGTNDEMERIRVAAHYAADWVRHYNITLGLNIKYWELGNEDYGRWQMGRFIEDDVHSTLGDPIQINGVDYLENNGVTYAQICNIFADSMKAADPSILIGAVCFESNDDLYPDDWNDGVILNLNENLINFLIVHQYFHPSSNKNDISEDEMYAAIDAIEHAQSDVKDVVELAGLSRDYYGIMMTEFNSRGGNREISRTNALFISMCLGELIEHDYEGAMMWDLENGFDDDNSDGGSPDDHGMTAKGDPCLEDGDMNPSGYAHYYFNRYFGDTLIQSISSDSKIYTYATTFKSGEIGVVVVNTNSSSKTIDIDLEGVFLGDRMFWHTITGDGDVDRTCYINGVGPDPNDIPNPTDCEQADGASGPKNYADVLPRSSLIDGNQVKFNADGYSVNYIVFETSETTGCAIPTLGEDQFLCGTTEVLLNSNLSSANKTITWYDETGIIAGENNPTLLVNTAGTYTVEVDSNACILTEEIEVLDDIGAVDLGEDLTLCQETFFELNSGLSTGFQYEWYENGVLLPESSNGLTVSTAGVYSVVVSASGCFSVSDEITISSGLPNITTDTTCYAGDQVTLMINETGNYSWYDVSENGMTLSSDLIYQQNPVQSTLYYVQDNNLTNQTFGKSVVGNTFGNSTTATYENNNRKLEVTVSATITLVSLDVNITNNNTDGQINIVGATTSTFPFTNLSSGMNTVMINTTLQPGVYEFNLIGSDVGVRTEHDDTQSNSVEGIIEFESKGGVDWYGSFYNWVIGTSTTCSRTPVEVIVDDVLGGCADCISKAPAVKIGDQLAFQNNCIEGEWTHFYTLDNQNEILFSIKNGNNTTEYVVDVTDGEMIKKGNENDTTYVMGRQWNVNIIDDEELEESVSIRFYFEDAELQEIIDASNAFENSDPNVDVTPITWFKTSDGLAFDENVHINYDGRVEENTLSLGVNITTSSLGNGISYVQLDNISSFSGGSALITAGTEIVLSIGDDLLSVDGLKGKIQIAPNPSSEVFQVQVPLSNALDYKIVVYDALGRKVEELNVESNSIQLGRSYIPGIYTVVIYDGIEAVSHQIIKL